jgi:hypothetical protein
MDYKTKNGKTLKSFNGGKITTQTMMPYAPAYTPQRIPAAEAFQLLQALKNQICACPCKPTCHTCKENALLIKTIEKNLC